MLEKPLIHVMIVEALPVGCGGKICVRCLIGYVDVVMYEKDISERHSRSWLRLPDQPARKEEKEEREG